MAKWEAPEVYKWLTGEQKAEMEKKGIRFFVMEVSEPEENTYQGVTKLRHKYTIECIDPKTGERQTPVILAMTVNDYRTRVAKRMGDMLNEDPSGVGPCVLVAEDFGGANPAWTIKPAPEA